MLICVTPARVPQLELHQFASRRSSSAKSVHQKFAATVYWTAYFYNKVS